MLRATVTSSFALTGRGTVLTLKILDGSVKAGEVVRLAMGARSVEVRVRSVEFVDCAVGLPSYRAEPAILIEGLEPSEVPPGSSVSS